MTPPHTSPSLAKKCKSALCGNILDRARGPHDHCTLFPTILWCWVLNLKRQRPASLLTPAAPSLLFSSSSSSSSDIIAIIIIIVIVIIVTIMLNVATIIDTHFGTPLTRFVAP